MADQDRSLDFQMVEHSRDIASACRQIVSIGWVTRGTKPATRDGDDAILIGELIGEVVEHMCGVPQTSKHHQRRAIPAQSRTSSVTSGALRTNDVWCPDVSTYAAL
jgi:hypothetical protein